MSNQRRSRYTVTLASGEKKVVLAYTADAARNYFGGVSAAKGDFRQRVPQPTGAKPSALGLRQAQRALGLELPVEVKVNSRKSFTLGGHRLIPAAPGLTVKGNRVYGDTAAAAPIFRHLVIVKSWLTAEEMGETLWHELTHALQFERDVLPRAISVKHALRIWHAEYFDGTGYGNKRQEREANANMIRNRDIPLAR